VAQRSGTAAAVLFVVAYAAALHRGATAGSIDVEEALTVLVIVGGAFTALAWALLRRTAPVPGPDQSVTRSELAASLGLLAIATAYLAGGVDLIDRALPPGASSSPAVHELVTLAKKLLVFVVLPYGTLHWAFGRRAADFGLSLRALRALAGRQGLATVVLAVVVCGFQLVAGRAAAPIRSGEIAGSTLVTALALTFLWLILEVGLVEEFFFRAVLQSRIAAAAGSEAAGVFITALLFGLAHAPGYVLRSAGVADALGTHPSALDATAYALVVPAVASFLFAFLWLHTRNLYVGILIHAAMDTLPNATRMAQAWGLL